METPKYERLKQVIKNKIQEGIWKPGYRIPVERILCEQFGVSKITVKKAKDELIAEGIVEYLPGRKGAFVKQARLLSPSSAGLIAVAIDDIRDPLFAQVFKGIEDQLWEHKLHTILCNAYSDIEKIEAYIYSLIEQNIAGIIFTPVVGSNLENNQRIITMLAEKHIPYVLVDRYLPGSFLNAVVSHNIQGARDLTNSLLEKGHTRILVFAGSECSSMDERVHGHSRALQEAGIAHDPQLLIRASEVFLQSENQEKIKEELERVKGLFHQAGDFTACCAMNGTLLQAAIRTIFSNNHSFPKNQIEFATYDYSVNELFGHTRRVTIAKQPGYQMGWEAAKLLLKNIKTPGQYTVHMALKTAIVENVIE